MGYTHYWYRETSIPTKSFNAIVKDFKTIQPEFHVNLGDWEGSFGTKPSINKTLVSFNGIGEYSHESMYFPKVLNEDRITSDNGLIFQFCKTARKPYDIAVCSFLIIAKHYLGDKFKVHSDGEIKDEWQDSMNLCQEKLGYGSDFNLSRD